MSSPSLPPHVESMERKKHSSPSPQPQPSVDGAVPSTYVAPPPPPEPKEWLTLSDACTIAQAEVARRFKTGDDSPLPKTFTDVLRSWRWQDDRKDPAPPPPQSEEEEEHYITQEDMCAIAQAEVRRHFMSFSSLDERRGKNDPRWKR